MTTQWTNEQRQPDTQSQNNGQKNKDHQTHSKNKWTKEQRQPEKQ